MQYDKIMVVKTMAIVLISVYLAGIVIALILCEVYESERRQDALWHGNSIPPPICWEDKLRLAILWPFYLLSL